MHGVDDKQWGKKIVCFNPYKNLTAKHLLYLSNSSSSESTWAICTWSFVWFHWLYTAIFVSSANVPSSLFDSVDWDNCDVTTPRKQTNTNLHKKHKLWENEENNNKETNGKQSSHRPCLAWAHTRMKLMSVSLRNWHSVVKISFCTRFCTTSSILF